MNELPQWEYLKLEQSWRSPWRVAERQWSDLFDALNELGRDGWECVSVVLMPNTMLGSPLYQYAVLKRVSPAWIAEQEKRMMRKSGRAEVVTVPHSDIPAQAKEELYHCPVCQPRVSMRRIPCDE
jgi:hypothetical protein